MSACSNVFATSWLTEAGRMCSSSDWSKMCKVVARVLTIDNVTKMLNFHYSCPTEFEFLCENRSRSFFFFFFCVVDDFYPLKILVARRTGLR